MISQLHTEEPFVAVFQTDESQIDTLSMQIVIVVHNHTTHTSASDKNPYLARIWSIYLSYITFAYLSYYSIIFLLKNVLTLMNSYCSFIIDYWHYQFIEPVEHYDLACWWGYAQLDACPHVLNDNFNSFAANIAKKYCPFALGSFIVQMYSAILNCLVWRGFYLEGNIQIIVRSRNIYVNIQKDYSRLPISSSGYFIGCCY